MNIQSNTTSAYTAPSMYGPSKNTSKTETITLGPDAFGTRETQSVGEDTFVSVKDSSGYGFASEFKPGGMAGWLQSQGLRSDGAGGWYRK